jgi:hypothetical protein
MCSGPLGLPLLQDRRGAGVVGCCCRRIAVVNQLNLNVILERSGVGLPTEQEE